MSASVSLAARNAQIDIHADQRGRIIGSCVAIFAITDLSVILRLVSRKLARAGYWVRTRNIVMLVEHRVLMARSSGTMSSPLLQW